MSWWSPTRLVGFRERLSDRLRSWLLPFAAVYEADLASLVRSWTLRAWFVLTAFVALVSLLGHAMPGSPAPSPTEGVIHAILRPIDTSSGDVHTLAELFKSYIVLWTTFVILLSGGAITSELGVVADSVLSRGISRWQYFFGKWTARLTAVLGVYLLVMAPTAAVVWLTTTPGDIATGDASEPVIERITQVAGDANDSHAAPHALALGDRPSVLGLAFSLAHVAALLALVVTCGLAFSATLENTILAVGAAWVTVYGAGLVLWILGVRYLSPGSLFRNLPDLLHGNFVAAFQWWNLAAQLCLMIIVAIVSGVLFSRRDV